jgi:hypothetical protein
MTKCTVNKATRREIFMVQPVLPSNGKNKTADNRDEDKLLPATVVEMTNSSQSQMSSIDIGEFGMTTSKKGNTTTFAMVVRDKLFPKVKFIGGTNTSLDYSTEPTSICGLMRLHCNVSHADAYQWWEEQCSMVKTIHTECRNNKIKNIKQLFKGKLIS